MLYFSVRKLTYTIFSMETNTSEILELIIIGSGPAGLTAGIYSARANLTPTIFAGQKWGGQLMNTTEVENYPGFPEGILGPSLINSMVKQAKRFGANIIYQDVLRVELSPEGPQKVYAGNKAQPKEYLAKAVIVASGARPRMLDIPGEAEYWGKGISSCATCDGAFYRDKVVAVVGGGDSAMEEATFLTRFASKVYLIHRRDELRASKIMQERARTNSKIEFILSTEIRAVLGHETAEGHSLDDENNQSNLNLPLRAQGKVGGLKIENVSTKEVKTLAVDGLFLGIGYIPETELFARFIDVDANGYAIPTVRAVAGTEIEYHTMSKIPGVFIAGDVEDHRYRQAITAAADGCKAALDAEKWLMLRE